ncbi:Carbamoyl-phosphate synthase arginine-specific small chain, partial [Termitomyces sp. T112]
MDFDSARGSKFIPLDSLFSWTQTLQFCGRSECFSQPALETITSVTSYTPFPVFKSANQVSLRMFSRQFIRIPRLTRGLATHTGPITSVPATLHLKTGQSFYGRSFGAHKSIYGETVFSTSITSYTESMTDPSYRGQILVFTTPLIGNYGVPHNKAPFDSQDVGVILE